MRRPAIPLSGAALLRQGGTAFQGPEVRTGASKAARQDVQQEATDELVSFESHGPLLIAAGRSLSS